MGDAGDPREGAEEDVRLDGGETKKTRRHGGWRASAKMISIYGRVHEVLGQDRDGRAYRKSLFTCFMLLMAFLQTGHCFFTLIAVVRHTWQNTCLWRG